MEEELLIGWSNAVFINLVHEDIAVELRRLYGDHGHVEEVLGDVWACEEGVLPTAAAILETEEEEPLEAVEVRPLGAEHAEGIHELYPVNDMECRELFLRLISKLPAAGVFIGGKLAAWMVQSYYGAMFSMQTKPEHRRKGYGTRLARFLAGEVARRGYRPFVVIRPENEASQSLYAKLGFRRLFRTVRMSFQPQ